MSTSNRIQCKHLSSFCVFVSSIHFIAIIKVASFLILLSFILQSSKLHDTKTNTMQTFKQHLCICLFSGMNFFFLLQFPNFTVSIQIQCEHLSGICVFVNSIHFIAIIKVASITFFFDLLQTFKLHYILIRLDFFFHCFIFLLIFFL